MKPAFTYRFCPTDAQAASVPLRQRSSAPPGGVHLSAAVSPHVPRWESGEEDSGAGSSSPVGDRQAVPPMTASAGAEARVRPRPWTPLLSGCPRPSGGPGHRCARGVRGGAGRDGAGAVDDADAGGGDDPAGAVDAARAAAGQVTGDGIAVWTVCCRIWTRRARRRWNGTRRRRSEVVARGSTAAGTDSRSPTRMPHKIS